MTNETDGTITGSLENSNQKLVWIIVIIGALPVIILTVTIVLFGGHSSISASLIDAYKVYSAIVLSFLGGIHWGIVLGAENERPASKPLIMSLSAPLIGWSAVFIAEPLCFALLIVGFAGQGAWDNFSAHNGNLPLWFSKIRLTLTLVVILLLAITMYATA